MAECSQAHHCSLLNAECLAIVWESEIASSMDYLSRDPTGSLAGEKKR